MQLLEHEQLHFDLAELTVRKIMKRFDEMRGACAEPDGTEAIHHAITQAERALQEEQEQFDRETNHGINAAAQDRWKRRIRQQLDRP